MHHLFIKSIATQNWEVLEDKVIYLVIIYTAVLAAMMIDLIFGLRKARIHGELRSSMGLRRTVDKGLQYFSWMLIATIMDVIASLIIEYPYFTMVAGLFLTITEIKSILESYDKKERDKIILTSRQLADLIRERQNLLMQLPQTIEQLTQSNEEEQKDETVS
ncbi:MAG: hypothetical protein RL662_437 [Bacteroidota bacterium]|jgi:phage-related holin